MLFLLCSVTCLILLPFIDSSIQLQCLNDSIRYKISNSNINVEVKRLADYGLLPYEPCAYDLNGHCHRFDHLSRASLSKYFCLFTMHDFIISERGAILENTLENKHIVSMRINQVTFDHESISGLSSPYYNAELVTLWHQTIQKFGSSAKTPSFPLETHDHVVPMRNILDNCYNHVSFAVTPMLGAVYLFYRPVWRRLTFHCSNWSAAIVNLMGVPMDRIVVERTILAKQVLMPWIPHWQPFHSASMKSISLKVSSILTKTLLTKQFDDTITRSMTPLKLQCPSHPKVSSEVLMSLSDPFRYIVYNSRGGQDWRDVYHESELLQMISKVLNKTKYRLVVMGSVRGYNGIEEMQASWQRCAKVYTKAIIMMGPHGSTSNNVMFVPADCHCIEFNHFPEENYEANTTSVRSVAMNAHFAKGGTGKYYNIEPNNSTNKVGPDMYNEGWMKISQRDVVLTLMQINKDLPDHDLLVDGINVMDVPTLSEADLKAPTKKSDEELTQGREMLRRLPPSATSASSKQDTRSNIKVVKPLASREATSNMMRPPIHDPRKMRPGQSKSKLRGHGP